MKSIMANAEIEKTLVNTGRIKRSQSTQKTVLELQNRCSTTELNWRTDTVQFSLSPASASMKRGTSLGPT